MLPHGWDEEEGGFDPMGILYFHRMARGKPEFDAVLGYGVVPIVVAGEGPKFFGDAGVLIVLMVRADGVYGDVEVNFKDTCPMRIVNISMG